MAGWTELIVDAPKHDQPNPKRDVNAALASWVWGKVDKWTQHRNRRFERRWKEYWRLWRGYWNSEDRTRESERSRLIAPALAAAIDSQVSEVTAMFDRAGWLDLPDDLSDEQKADMMLTRDLLLEDLELTRSEAVFREAILNSAIFGTGIVKVNTTIAEFKSLQRDPETFDLIEEIEQRALVTHEAVRPDQFAIEPGACSIEEAMGVAHTTRKPMHWAMEEAERGRFDIDAVRSLSNAIQAHPHEEVDSNEKNLLNTADPHNLEIIEYHGKVPAELLKMNDTSPEKDPLAALLAEDQEDSTKKIDEDTMVEAIVVIANKGWILQAKVNPFVDKCRSFVAFPWEHVPNQFWGRGLGERGYNPQKALDAELRAHIDSLGFSTFPMIGVDSGRLSKSTRLEVKPGKVWVTDGDPKEVLSPFKFDGLDQANFENARSMERLVGVGTGSLDLDGAVQASGTQAGPTVLGLQHASQIKRAKRAGDNISKEGLAPIIAMTVKRYMQFEPTRYPNDFKFRVAAGMGLMARELEATQLNQAMLALPDELAGPVKLTMVKSLLANLSVDNKAEIEAAIDQAMTPSPEEQEQQRAMAELALRERTAQVEELEAKVAKLRAEAGFKTAQTQTEFFERELKSDQVDNETRRVALDAESNAINRESNDIQRESLQLQRQKLSATS